jgi:hypothetical protein
MISKDKTLSENVEALFDTKISSSGADITIKLGDEQVTVPYEVFSRLRDSIESVIVWYSNGKLAEEFDKLKMPYQMTILGGVVHGFTAGLPEGAGFAEVKMENSDWQCLLVRKGSGYQPEVDALIAATEESDE